MKMKLLIFGIIGFLLLSSVQISSGLIITTKPSEQDIQTIEIDLKTGDLPSSFDWRNIDGIDFTTPIRKQQPFASCESFAFVAAVEARVQIKVGYPFGCDLSEAHLYFWCNGNLDWGSFPQNDTDYLVKYGVPDEACWPYPKEKKRIWPKNTTCPNWQNRTVKIQSWEYFSPGDIEAIKHAIVNDGPVPTYFIVYQDFVLYTGGIYNHRWGEALGPHYVCIVGYQDDPKIPSGGYWICKNSWGELNGNGRPVGETNPYDPTNKGGWFRIAYHEAGIDELAINYGEVYGNFPIVYVDDDNTMGPWDGTEEHPYQTVQEGIDNAYKGWTVIVKNGTYYENLEINKTVNVDGESKENTIIDGNGVKHVFNVSAPDVRISRLTIQNSGNKRANAGINLKSLNANITIKDNIFQNNNVGIFLDFEYARSGAIIKNNIIRDNHDGLVVWWSNNVQIKNNLIYNNTGNGIMMETSQRVTITNNEIYDNDECGLYIRDDSNDNTVQNNNITSNSIGVKLYEVRKNKINNNNFIDNDDQATFIKSFRTNWNGNYWNDWAKILPKIIRGAITDWEYPWFNFDWRPSKQPY